VADCSTDTTIYGDANCEYPAPDVTGIVTGTDNCSAFIDMTLSQNITPGSTLSAPQLIYVTLTDENGNTNTCTVQVDILDTIVPSISCPTTQTVSNGTNCDYQITDFTSLVTATDNCSTVTLTQLPGPGDEIGTGFHTVQIIAEDASGNKDTCSFSLQVKETVPPAISCPDDIVTCDPLVSYATPQVVENCPNFNSNQTDLSGLTSGDSFPVGVTNQEYTVIDASGNVASCNFDIEILPPLSTAEINTLTTQFCDTINTIIEAVVPVNGTGEWSVLEGGSVLNNESASTTGVNNLSYGANVFVWTVSSPICGSNSDTITVTVYEEPLSVNTQDSLTLCNDTLINIAASPASAGQGIWSDGAGNIQFQSPHSPNTVAYNFAEGWNDITWTVTNGTCPSKSDTIRLFKKSQSAIYTPDTTVCLLSDNFELIGSPIPQGVSGLWHIISGGVEFIDITTSTPIVTQINPGESMIVYGQSHPVCESTTDTLILNGVECSEYDPLIPTVITPNGDGKNDLFLIDKLNVLYPEAIVRIVNRWGNLVFESTGYSTPWDGSDMNSGKILPLGTYFYRIILNDQEDTEIDGSISIVR
jgi:gliding motility-associated-like protein